MVSPPVVVDPYGPPAAAWDPYAPAAPASGAYTGAYPGAPWQFGAQAPYGAPGGYPATPYPAWLPRPFRALRGLATALYVLLPLNAVLAALSAVAFFHRADVLGRLADAGEWGLTESLRTRADGSDALVTAAAVLLGISMTATGVVFVIWMYRTRANVDLFGPSRQHLSTGWAIGGWVFPLANLWFPKLIMHDIWRASDPRTAERDGRTPGRLPILWTWWVLFVGSAVVFFAARLSSPMGDEIELGDADRLRTIDILSGAANLVLVPAAIAAFLLVRRITTFQHDREAMALTSGRTAGGAVQPPWGGGPAPTGQFHAMPPQHAYAGPPVPQAPGTTPPAGPPPRPAAAPTAGMAPTAVEEIDEPDEAKREDVAAEPPVSLAKPTPPAAAEPVAVAVAKPAAGPEAEHEPAPAPELPTKPVESVESAGRPVVPPTRPSVGEDTTEPEGPSRDEADSIPSGERHA